MYKKGAIVLSIIALLGLFTIILSACKIVDSDTLNSGPQVHMGPSNFVVDTVTVPKGQSVILVDDSSSPHIIKNGTWENGVQKPATEAGAPTVDKNFAGNDRGPIGPFTQAGTFKVYCTIHPGMNLTITVQ